MEFLKSFLEELSFLAPTEFEERSLQLFRYQALHNPLYRDFVQYRKVQPQKLSRLHEIPFLPIELFKSHLIQTDSWNPEHVFESSGTTGQQTSRHALFSGALYHQLSLETFNSFFGDIKNWHVLALLPSYLERDNSSLVYMTKAFIDASDSPHSGFYLDQIEALQAKLQELLADQHQKVLLLGVTFALLDFAESYPLDRSYPGQLVVMETGGMKGRREELTREAVHNQLQSGFAVSGIASEYGMTELMSQAYSKGGGIFFPASTMKVMVREVEDPLTYVSFGRTGAINVIDLANAATCAFIETKDLGKHYEDGSFEVLGRMDNSDIRGCNLLVM